MSCAYRQAAWRGDFNAAITVVISLLTEKFPVVKLLGGRGAIWMVSSELVGGTSGSCCTVNARILGRHPPPFSLGEKAKNMVMGF